MVHKIPSVGYFSIFEAINETQSVLKFGSSPNQKSLHGFACLAVHVFFQFFDLNTKNKTDHHMKGPFA